MKEGRTPQAKTNKAVLFALALFIVITLVPLWLVLVRRQASRVARFSAEAQATVTKVDFTDYRTGRTTRERIETVVDESKGKRRRTTHVNYRYIVDGREFERQAQPRGDQREHYAVGSLWKVCYDPRYPEESILVALNEKCGAR